MKKSKEYLLKAGGNKLKRSRLKKKSFKANYLFYCHIMTEIGCFHHPFYYEGVPHDVIPAENDGRKVWFC